MHRSVLATCLAASLQTACATMLARDRELVSVTSDPPGAEVQVNGVPQGRTPMQLPLDPGNDQTIVVKVGSAVHTCVLAASIEPAWIVLDVVLGGVPVIVDAATGKWKSFDSRLCHAPLPAVSSPAGSPPPRIEAGSMLENVFADRGAPAAAPRPVPASARPIAASARRRLVLDPDDIQIEEDEGDEEDAPERIERRARRSSPRSRATGRRQRRDADCDCASDRER